jgi:dimeric dUTPase (all-alpha-NTP-PPase superfamily)
VKLKRKWLLILKKKRKFKVWKWSNKAAIESEKNAYGWIETTSFYLSLSIAEKLLKDELSNKEAQTKLVEKMLGDVKLN